MAERDDLTGLLAEIADIPGVGVDAALAVARARGGTLAGIPSVNHLTASHWLVTAVGMEKARLISEGLVSAAKGDRFKIPVGPEAGVNAFIRAQRAAIEEALESGATIGEAARIAGASRSSVMRAKERLRQTRDDRQGRLF